MRRCCYFNTLLSLPAFTCISADGNSCFPVVGIRESYAEVVISSHHLHRAFPSISESIQWEDEFTASSESARR